MVKGETYNKQLFESEAFRHFINVFTNKESGVTLGCEVTKDTQNITVGEGYFFIQGGLLRETTGTANAIPSEAGYYKLVYEIDLSKINTKDAFNQGSYKFIKALGDYPALTQEDLDDDGTIYQLPFCQFRITEQGLQDFEDTRIFIDYGIYEKKKSKITCNKVKNVQLTKNGNTKISFESFKTTGKKLKYDINESTIIALEECDIHVSINMYAVNISTGAYIFMQVLKNEIIQHHAIGVSTGPEVCNPILTQTPPIHLKKGEYIYFNAWTSDTQKSPYIAADGRTYFVIEEE